MVKYNWKREDREDMLSLPKITSKVSKKKHNSTQVERHIASLKYNISKTNQNLESLDSKIEEKTDDFKAINQNLVMTSKNMNIKEKQVESKKKQLIIQKIEKSLSLFSAYVTQKKAKELSNYRERVIRQSK
jgi:predicted  nucleic acid-binding Zn-ribbon protein